MRVRAALGCAALALSVPASAPAATKPVCDLVVDARGDARDPYLGPVADDSSFDLLAGDIAANSTTVTAVIRLARIAESADPLVGTTYTFQFNVDGSDYVYLSADTAGLASGFSAWEHHTTPTPGTRRVGTATGVVDVARKEVRISTSVRTFTKPIRTTSTITGLRMRSTRWYGYGGDPTVGRVGTGPDVDEAESARSYRVGSASCVRVGK